MIDPNSYLNQLRTFMQFYDQNGLGGPNGSETGFSGAQNLATNSGNRLNFALRMAQNANGPMMWTNGGPGVLPDTFGGLPSQPQPAAPLAPNMIPQSQLPQVPPPNLLSFQFRR